MRLKKIKLAGFKSFVDPTTIDVPSRLIGIVGPNGCGKSNVIDAVRWVMGESSAKHLRGDAMNDVIFNGSAGRKPVGQASVELVFDNTEGRLGGQYAAYSEIAVKREVARDGQSTYYLNGTRCRRRDIADIFLGTGLGPRSYAIIEQGTISRLVEAKPEDMRLFIEEAAGISKYKERRRETENRLRHTRENLDRINDIVTELQKRIDYLQRQSQTAEKFKVFKQDERLLRGQLLALRWQSLDQQSASQNQAIQSLETQVERHAAEVRRLENAIEQQREQQHEGAERFNQAQGEFYSIGADIARLEQTIQHHKQMREQQRQDLAQLEQSLTQIESHLAQDRGQVAHLTGRLEEREPALAQLREAEVASAAALTAAEQSLAEWQHRWDQFHADTSAHARSTEVERTRIEHREQQLQQLDQRLARLQEQHATLQVDDLEIEINGVNDEVKVTDEDLARLRQELQTHVTAIAGGRERHDNLARRFNAGRDGLHTLQRDLATLEAQQHAALGEGHGAAAPWLERHQLDKAQRLAHALEVEPGWERAVETVLGFQLEAVCVDDVAALAADIAVLDKGAVTLFDTGRAAAGQGAAAAGELLLHKVKAPWALASFLAGVHVAPDLDAALARRDGLAPGESVITPQGLWLGPDWLRVVRDDADNKAGVLQREQEIKTLRQRVEGAEAELQSLQSELTAAAEELKRLEQEREARQAEVAERAQRSGELHAQLSARQARLEQLRARAEQLQRDMAEVEQNREQGRAELAEARGRLERAAATMHDQSQQRERLLEERDGLRAALDAARTQARHDQGARHETALEVESLRTQLRSTQENLERMQHQFDQQSRRRTDLASQMSDGDGPVQGLNDELTQLLSRRVESEEALSSARQALDLLDQDMRRMHGERSASEQRLEETRSELEQLRLGWQEVKVRRQTLIEQLTETGQEIEALVRDMPEEAEEGEWEKRLEDIERRIQRLGPINLAAIDEFSEQSQRKAYLDEQQADLNEAVATLDNAIRRIDRETRERFKNTFDQVNAGFQDLFPRLFGGGQAYLELTGEDLLDTGITVMARPPGKRNSTIHLLSGGEKALTAVALVFSIFELNPAPFCILDEVDAPLDDTNVLRYSQLVAKMSERIQFIYITHNKISMEMANQLIGVTMHEPGVSRLVEVDVDQAVELAVANG